MYHFRVLCCWLILTILLLAQESQLKIVGKPFKAPYQIEEVKDSGGRHCAAVQVITTIKDIEYFAPNGVFKVVKAPDYNLVYVSPDEEELEIYDDSCKVRVVFPDFGIQLASRQVWTITLEAAKEKLPSLHLESIPRGAVVYLNNSKIGETPLTLPYPVGIYLIRLERNGYIPHEETFELTPVDTSFS